MKTLSIYIFIIGCFLTSAYAQATPPKVLIVTAHPDDESGMAATVYKITQELGGVVDLSVITNGEAGYKYSLFAEGIYKQNLTTEAVGRKYLPAIRRKELRAGCNWVGIRKIHFFNQLDTYYTLDADSVLTRVWNVMKVKQVLTQQIKKAQYDFIFCLLPTQETHGHHKAASILALETVKNLPVGIKKPIILGVSGGTKTDTLIPAYSGLPQYPITRITEAKPSFMTDRTVSFGYKNKLNYKIIANWLIAEHKSQGTMQTYMNQGDYEHFWFFDINNPADKPVAAQLFQQLKLHTPAPYNPTK